MRKSVAKSFSVIALICSVFPVLSYLLAVFKFKQELTISVLLAQIIQELSRSQWNRR